MPWQSVPKVTELQSLIFGVEKSPMCFDTYTAIQSNLFSPSGAVTVTSFCLCILLCQV